MLPGVLHQLEQLGTLGLRSAPSGIDVFRGDLPAAASDIFPKLPELHVAVLIGRADSGVDGYSHGELGGQPPLPLRQARLVVSVERVPSTLRRFSVAENPDSRARDLDCAVRF